MLDRERRAQEVYARLLAESRPVPQVAASPAERITEVQVAREGAVHVRVGTPAALTAVHGRTPRRRLLSGAAERENVNPRNRFAAITVIIPTTGGPRIHRCVRALHRAAGRLQLHVILVVTGGVEGSLPPCEQVVRADPPFCWARANNAGLSRARDPLVLLLNDDRYFTNDSDLERLVRRLHCCGHLMAVAPAGTGFPAAWEQSRVLEGAGLVPVRLSPGGACVLLRREAFDVVGPFDERFATYGCDEMDWFFRARGHGYRWAIDADVRIEHEWGATYGARAGAEHPTSHALFQHLHGVDPGDGPHWNRPRCEVSWVMASRNGARYLARSLGSIAAVRHLYPAGADGMEVVLALDASTDSSAAVAEAFNASLPEPLPLRMVRFTEPAGDAGNAKNRALRLATGAVHLPLDDDDATLPARAELLHALDDNTDVVVGDFWLVGIDGSVEVKHVAPVTFDRLSRPGGQNWGPWATAIRAGTWEKFGMFRDELDCEEDLDLWLRWLRDGVRFRHVPVPVHLYLMRPGSAVFRHSMLAGDAIRQQYRAECGPPALGMQAFADHAIPR